MRITIYRRFNAGSINTISSTSFITGYDSSIICRSANRRELTKIIILDVPLFRHHSKKLYMVGNLNHKFMQSSFLGNK